ncbi:tripartite motif-containing protein 14-like [Sphaeramia orbicularis]|uniref:Tripartite motif-containing protein 14-like n=1 Tax=Sphaeramia orbicularis TaxID=375764 RepID=A0A672ZUW8_9TELE|nr:tripartite motif-containing protein 14-like [Sphaeramia orbicularis]XP_029988945.1 tripartite motif-containing protein 14-like [Sphaeramia orbicularis]
MSSLLENDRNKLDSDEDADVTSEPNPGDVRVKDLKTSPRPKTLISPLDLIREDLGHFRDDLVNMFKDRDGKTANTLSLLKDDFNSFKDDFNSVFRKNLPKEKVKEDPPNTVRTKVPDLDRLDEHLKSPFRDQRLLKSFQRDETKKKVSMKTEEELDDEFTADVSQQNRETVHEKLDGNVKNDESDSKTCISETLDIEEMIFSLQKAQLRYEREERNVLCRISEDEPITEEDVNISSFPLMSLSTGIKLLSLREADKHEKTNQPQGDMWSIKNFAGYLTLDPNTANSELQLTNCNRTATRVWLDRRPSDHPDRFECCPQLLCREGLLDNFYWEATWSGGADIGVTYNSISRVGDAMSCLLGHNRHSWTLECSEGSYTPCHNNRRFKSYSPRPFTHRVGVFLDWAAGSLSFYSVSRDNMVHIHTFHSTFTEPLYPGFWVWAYEGSVSLCQVELDWERLLQ